MKKLFISALAGAMVTSSLITGAYAAETQVFAVNESHAYGATTEVTQIETGIDGISLSIGADSEWKYSKDTSGGSQFTGRINGKDKPDIDSQKGTYYAISVDDSILAGNLDITYQIGKGKGLVVMDGSSSLYESANYSAKTTDSYSFIAEEGHTYYVYANGGSKLGFYGFTFTEGTQADFFADEINSFSFDNIKGENTDINSVEYDLELPDNYSSQFGSCDVRWESTDPNVIDVNGNVNCQKTETKVTLTGIFSVQEDDSLTARKSFEITVAADPDDASAVAAAKESLTIGDTSSVKSDISLPSSGRRGTAITWQSSDESIITNDGKITRAPRQDKTAVLTATITRGEESDTKAFTVTVAGYVPITIDAYSYGDADGNTRFTPVDGGTLKSVSVTRGLTEPTQYDVLIAAVYNAEGRLKSCKNINLADIDEGKSMPVGIGLPMDSTDSFKLFAVNTYDLTDYMEVYTPDDKLKDGAKIYVVGDSTAAIYNDSVYPRKGWAQMLQNYFDGTEVVDLALSGRSSVNFKTEANYTKLWNEIKPGDYLIIQFGHNDSKADDTTRYSDPSGDRFTEGSFQNSMNEYVTLAREKGAIPIIATSISRRRTSDSGLEAYVNAAKELAEAVNAPCIDLYAQTNSWINEVGTEQAKDMFNYVKPKDSRFTEYSGFANSGFYAEGTTDDTHINIYGADLIAQWAAESIKNLGIPVSQTINDYRAVYPLPSYEEATSAE